MLNIAYPAVDKFVSLHNHTTYSDGASSAAELCQAAKANGLRVLGISDHWVVPPYEGTDYQQWAMDHRRLDDYVNELKELQKQYNDDTFTLKIGLEVDFFFENHADTIQNLAGYNFDYLIGSVHYTGVFSVDHDSADWLPLDEDAKDKICNLYWDKLEGAAACRDFDFIGHLDLPKKFGMIDNKKYFPRAVKVLDTIRQNGGAIEINTAGWFKNCAEPYPAPELLQAASERSIPVVISADAHCAEHLQRNFDTAAELLVRSGYNIC